MKMKKYLPFRDLTLRHQPLAKKDKGAHDPLKRAVDKRILEGYYPTPKKSPQYMRNVK